MLYLTEADKESDKVKIREVEGDELRKYALTKLNIKNPDKVFCEIIQNGLVYNIRNKYGLTDFGAKSIDFIGALFSYGKDIKEPEK